LERAAVRTPPLIATEAFIENAGNPYLEETIALMYHYPQVYVDLSTITWIIPRSMLQGRRRHRGSRLELQ
jgi:hypothetical protein